MLELAMELKIFDDLSVPEAKDVADAKAFMDERVGKSGIRKVLFVAPPDADETMFDCPTARRGRYWNYPPYGVGVLATQLRERGIEVQIVNLNDAVLRGAAAAKMEEDFDFAAVTRDAVVSVIDDFEPDFVGVTCMFSQTHQSTIDTCEMLRDVMPDTALALGGVHISNSFLGPQTRDAFVADFPRVDFLFVYESEVSFLTFISVANGELEADALCQVLFNMGDHCLYFARVHRPTGEVLNSIPAYDLLQPRKLNEVGKIGTFFSLLPPDTGFATALSNRGCRAQCTFCSVRNFNGVGVRTREVQSVIDELLLLRDKYDIGHVMWLDDDFLYDRKRSMRLFEEMVKQDVGVTWDCTNGVIAASCTEEMMDAAAASGCIGLNIGMESGNTKILREIKKPGTIKNFIKAADVLRKIEQINARIFIMIGFPGETYRQIMDTIDVVKEMDLDWTNVFILQPLPNTPIFDKVMGDGMVGNVDFNEIRFTTGGYGKLRKSAEKARDMLSADFKDAFSRVDLDAVPSPRELDDVWAYMNFHLNFARLFRDDRRVKLEQQYKWLRNITTLIAPDNAMAQYFQAYVHYKLTGEIEHELVEKLRTGLEGMTYWQERFNDYDLSVEDLETCRFPVDVANRVVRVDSNLSATSA
jgi:radical SAM superfamily enzyme YgiQ (UPF0313 family)